MKIVIASDSFKGSLSSREVGEATARGLLKIWPEADIDIITIADGGEGTLDSLTEALNGKVVKIKASDPLGRKIDAGYGVIGETAIIEIAQASGLTLIEPSERDPRITSSYGTGEIIADALRRGCRKFHIGLGGSAVNDAGSGMLRALGFRFLDRDGEETGVSADRLSEIKFVDSSRIIPALKEAQFTVACDVSNPLVGPNGASFVFGPQKGASPEIVEKLDDQLKSFAQVTEQTICKNFSMTEGAGAAGGLGFAFLAYLHGKLIPGIDMILDAVNFNERIKDADLIITGEGRLDRQTLMGKTPYGVLQRANLQNIPVIAIGGTVTPDAIDTLKSAGFKAIIPVTPETMSLKEAMRPVTAAANIERAITHTPIIKHLYSLK